MAGKAVKAEKEMSFWDHLEELRWVILRSLASIVVFTVLLFCFKDVLFKIVLGPTSPDFFLYRWLGLDTGLTLINTQVSAQFMVHMKVAAIGGLLISFPYLLFEIWRFIAPALYKKEKRGVRVAFFFASFLFYLGLAVGYVMVLPLMVNFFSSYSVSADVTNMISLDSYISTFSSSVLLFGLVFEFPAIVAVLSRMGLLYRDTIKKGWRYAILVAVVLAAIITPSGDLVSLAIVTLPLFILYLFSILVCKKRPAETEDEPEEDEE